MIVKGKPKPILVRQSSALLMKRIARKGCQVYAVHVEELGQKTEKELVENLPVIREFKDAF